MDFKFMFFSSKDVILAILMA